MSHRQPAALNNRLGMPAASGGTASLHWEISGHAELGRTVSDHLGEFGEHCGEPKFRAGVDSEFVVAATQILDEGVAGDHDLGCPISLEAAHRSHPALELTVIGFYGVVGVLLDVVPRRGDQFVEHAGIDGAASVTTSSGVTLSVRSARVKNRRAAAASRWTVSSTSMTWPCWSTARYT